MPRNPQRTLYGVTETCLLNILLPALIFGTALPQRLRLSALDLVIVAAYLVGITLFGLSFRKRNQADKSLKSYFLADNTIPWWAIALSIVSAETSTLTIISVPGVAFAGTFGFLQIVIGYMLGRIVVAMIFLPRYFAGEMLTAYQLIDRRFGHTLHKVTAGLFLCTRAAAEGVRVFAVSIVVGLAIGTGNVLSIAIISALTLLYTFEGGMAAVVWTDVVQMILYVAGTLVALFTLGTHVSGGWTAIHAAAGAAGKLTVFNFALNLTTTYTFWAGVLGGTFLTMASHGTDQLMVQRLLAARNLRESRLALLSSGGVIFLQFTLFLLIGAGLWVFYGQHPGTTFRTGDYIFPTFIVREMPIGVAGVLVAAILAAAMSNLSAALNSLSSTTVVDFYMRARPNADARERGLIARASTVVWALVLFAIAVYSLAVGGKGHVVEVGLSIASVAYGCLLGVFLLGTLTKYATETGTILGMICGFAVNLWLWQGTFPVHLGRVLIPHIAWTWYVLIGALVTFAIGSLFSLVFKASSRTKRSAVALGLPLFFLLSFPRGVGVSAAEAQQPAPPATDFAQVSQLINAAIAQQKLPGAVVLVGHNGSTAFEQAYGNRKLAGEPGLDGKPSPAEPMTEDTIFDMASLTKDLATATSVMQLYDAGKLQSFDDPIEKYLPAFNPQHDPERAKVTVRLLLTHFTGEAPDVKLSDAWGLAAPDREEGFHRALTTPLAGTPGAKFVYSDINFILLGRLVEVLSRQREDDYVREHIFRPLGMIDTRYHAFDRACGPSKHIGDTTLSAYDPHMGRMLYTCRADSWSPGQDARVAPTQHDNESKADPALNPDFDLLLRGTVHDPTARRMGGVAGHAGVFSTAQDVSLFASALLEKLLHNTGPFPVKQSTLQLMSAPEQPGHSDEQLALAQQSNDAALARGQHADDHGKPDLLLAPAYPAVKGQDLRGFGWDIDTGFSKPRGMIFALGSFGHTGFTGTSLWMDPASDTYVILLANAVHPYGGHGPISSLRGEVATAAAEALHLDGTKPEVSSGCVEPCVENASAAVQTGIDVLESEHFTPLTSLLNTPQHTGNIGVLTNQVGVDAEGHRTIDELAALAPRGLKLTTIFSPEHGIFGKQDSTNINAEIDPATGIHVTSLYGAGAAARHPSHAQLKDLDAVVIDLQDAGVHFWTYESVLGYFVSAALEEQTQFHHDFHLIVLDRPNPLGGLAVQGPTIEGMDTSYVAYFEGMPVRHGMTYGELAKLFLAADVARLGMSANVLTVVPMQGWQRRMLWADTGLAWNTPSPNLRSAEAATLYPALGLIEMTNVSVGRGTAHPFGFFGAGVAPLDKMTGAPAPQWFDAKQVAEYLTGRHIPGVTFSAAHEAIDEDANRYPFHGQTIEAVRVRVTDSAALDSPELGIEILAALHHLYPAQFALAKAKTLIANQTTMDALERGDDPRAIAASWQGGLAAFRAQRVAALLYP